ncbi:hypothetical protein [uncultured Leclercia sp.]|uniref:hypothetical protein n=1 Tax=uncultured Leclercia sp. TaxID=332959 RepID=UPI002592F549|nr:hypothetical protein [uncultured Leclercia sp.]
MTFCVEMETPSGLIARMQTDGIEYRHYHITKHAIQRFTERVTTAIDEIFISLDRVVLADIQQQKDHRVQDQIRRAERNGGYVLCDPETDVFFFVAMAGRLNAICTVMTLSQMMYLNKPR